MGRTIYLMGKRRKENSIPIGGDASAETIGERLARLRKSRGLTQGDLADMLGVTQPLVSSYERDELRLHGETIIQLTKILGVTADELLGLAGDAQEPPNAWIRRLAKKARDIERLSKRDQDALMRTIDAYLSKAS
jgi:transcriptional regulator with XRE-family HTH domain